MFSVFVRYLLFPVFLLVISISALAGASVYVSLQDRYLNERIDQLRVVARMPAMRKPFSVAEVRHYLNRIRYDLPGLFSEIDRNLRRYEQSATMTYAEIAFAQSNESPQSEVIPNARGESYSSDYRLAASGVFNPFEYVALSVGVTQRQLPEETVPTDSYIVLGSDTFQMDFGYREHWLSPFANGAMLFSTNAATPLSVGFANAIPFENWWQLQYEVFVAQLDRVPVKSGNTAALGRPVLLGSSLSFSPLDGWTIALARTMQFGGGDREVNLGLIWQAFSDPQSDHGAPSGEQCLDEESLCEFGNQVAAISNQIDFGGSTPFSVYFEFAGEDSEQLNNYYIGNLATSIGVFFPFLPDSLLGSDWSFRYEYQKWQDAWYVHHIYPSGYTYEGVILGHWGGSQRASKDAVGATMNSVVIGHQIGQHHRYEWRFQQLQNEDYGLDDYSTYRSIEFRYYDVFWQQNMMTSLQYGRDIYDDRFWRAELQWSW